MILYCNYWVEKGEININDTSQTLAYIPVVGVAALQGETTDPGDIISLKSTLANS